MSAVSEQRERSDWGDWAIFLGSVGFGALVLIYAWMGGLRDPAAFQGY
jgi:hypothetical protein